MNYRVLAILLAVLAFPFLLMAQTGTVTGRVTDAETGDALIAANVIIEGTTLGAAADAFGNFNIANLPAGTYTITASVIGYEKVSQTVNVPADGYVEVNFSLEATAIRLSALEVLASRATRETPVAFTNVEKVDMELRLGSRDIPLVLNTTPSVYATQQGGGAGDARINVRGFNQQNIAIMINGVPINDMENGWVYWSNWDGVGDATSSIQMQRGLSAVNLATPSIGGTMNVITDPASLRRGFRFKQEVGAGRFLKTTLMANSGLINDKLAFSGALVRKTGGGLIDAVWTDAWAYYLGTSYTLNAKNRFELYALGAPQRHGQNSYRQNIAVYSQDFAKDLKDYDLTDENSDGTPDVFEKYHEVGQTYNQNWSPVSESYTGKQSVGFKTFDRHAGDRLNERENFYNKPVMNLNWFTTLSENLRISSVAYYSGGTGGGTGTYGSLVHQSFEGSYNHQTGKYYYFGAPWSWDWDATIAINRDSTHFYIDKSEYTKETGESIGILRNSRNNQWTIGAISKAYYQLSDALKVTAGIDWRKANIFHYREVRDLLGGSYYVFKGNDFDTTPEMQKKRLGDKIDYDFTNTVDWIGFFGQGEYTGGPITAYGMAGYSTIAYSYTNHFKKDASGNELSAESGWISGYQVKGGLSYRLMEPLRVYANFGLVSKVPIFDEVIDDRTGIKNEQSSNEDFTSLEAGALFTSSDRSLTLRGNAYFTSWKNRAFKEEEFDLGGEEVLVFLFGVDANHSGIELEAAYQPLSLFRLDAAASLGNWVYTDDATGDFRIAGKDTSVSATFYIKDLKVGDAPQTQIALGVSLFPVKGVTAQLVVKSYANHYAGFSPFTRNDSDDRAQSWKAPSYTVLDLHGSYDLPFDFGGVKIQAFAHVFNLLDTQYIQDATDNSSYNSWDNDHDADDAEVFFGLPRSFNVGLALQF